MIHRRRNPQTLLTHRPYPPGTCRPRSPRQPAIRRGAHRPPSPPSQLCSLTPWRKPPTGAQSLEGFRHPLLTAVLLIGLCTVHRGRMAGLWPRSSVGAILPRRSVVARVWQGCQCVIAPIPIRSPATPLDATACRAGSREGCARERSRGRRTARRAGVPSAMLGGSSPKRNGSGSGTLPPHELRTSGGPSPKPRRMQIPHCSSCAGSRRHAMPVCYRPTIASGSSASFSMDERTMPPPSWSSAA